MASQPKKPTPKGILKKTTTSSSSGGGGGGSGEAVSSPPSNTAQKPQTQTQTQKKKKKPDPREVAIQHARIIHERRQLEDAITDSIITLAKLPHTLPPPPPPPPDPPSSPSSTTSPSSLFKSRVRLFQPSDYDALVEERNALGSCGYCLCARPRRQLPPGAGPYKLLGWGRAGFAIAPRAEVERWCSRACARRAMYVKVQLAETAAWERAGIESIRIELLEEVEAEKEREKQKEEGVEEKGDLDADADADADAAAKELEQSLRLRDETDRRQKAAQVSKDLALERGDTDPAKAAKRSVDVSIREKKVITAVQEPSLGPGGEEHLVLDGYKPKFDPRSESMSKGTTIVKKSSTEDDDDDDDVDGELADD